ncbi:MAG: hypothetical protein R6U27_03225, partial [Desulfobacterales bacterium]
FGYGINPEHGGQIISVLGLLQPSLKFEHGRILKIHHAKGAKAAIVKLMGNFTFLPRVFEFKNGQTGFF